MRSRSLLFFALGTAVAAALGEAVPLRVPENGLVSLNVPLTGTRLSSLSTRTTHPYFMERLAACVAALGEQTERYDVSASWGACRLPAEAASVSEALRLADERMYAHKGTRRGPGRGDALAA
jgi:hypothetical protein